jgi:Fe-S-cluster containining protein
MIGTDLFRIIRDQTLDNLKESKVDCSNCLDLCCKAGWDIELTSKESKKLLHVQKLNRFFLQKNENNQCFYYQSNKCSIYNERPKVCRSYTCLGDSKKLN